MHNALLRLLTAVFLFAIPAWAGDKKAKNMAVSFHLETEAAVNPKMVFEHPIGGKKHYFQKSPEFHTKDIVAFSPFLADNQIDFGVVFQLRPASASRLESITAANQGRLMLATCNGRVVDVVLIDKPVKDGFLVIWNGVQDAEIKECDKMAPRIGKDKEKKK
jgi:hypothetical protein